MLYLTIMSRLCLTCCSLAVDYLTGDASGTMAFLIGFGSSAFFIFEAEALGNKCSSSAFLDFFFFSGSGAVIITDSFLLVFLVFSVAFEGEFDESFLLFVGFLPFFTDFSRSLIYELNSFKIFFSRS